MYLSKLVLNTRSRAARLDLANPYEMHRTLARGTVSSGARLSERLLWRIDTEPATGQPWLLVQTHNRPDWGALLVRSEDYVLAAHTKEFRPAVTAGQLLSFRLRANPTVKKDGKRRALSGDEALIAWLGRQGRDVFRLRQVWVRNEGLVPARKSDRPIAIVAATFEGVMEVVSPEGLVGLIASGLGPAKSLGCGMLSIGPA